jgi:hypothetical protein
LLMDKSMPRKRPFGVTLLLWMVLSLLVWGMVRFFAALRAWDVLIEFGSSLSPLFLSITGAGWGVAGCVLLWSLFAGKQWARLAILTSISIWLIEYWIERVYFQSARANLPFAVLGSILIICITLISALHKSTLDFITRSEAYEQQNENPGSE